MGSFIQNLFTEAAAAKSNAQKANEYDNAMRQKQQANLYAQGMNHGAGLAQSAMEERYMQNLMRNYPNMYERIPNSSAQQVAPRYTEEQLQQIQAEQYLADLAKRYPNMYERR